jgi:hypothetical protein
MTKTEKCIELAEDYADRATSSSNNYDDAYEQYLKRCITREEDKVSQHWETVFNIKIEKPILNFI